MGRRCALCFAPIDHLKSTARFCGGPHRRMANRGESLPPKNFCRNCGEELVGKRRDAKWCDDPCRKAAKRAKAGPPVAKETLCSCPQPLPYQRRNEPWTCERCGLLMGAQ